MRTDSSSDNDLAEVFAMAEGGPVTAASPELLSAITSSGRRRRRTTQLAIAGPLGIVSAGIIIGGVALAGGSSHHVSNLVIKSAASSKPATKAQAAGGTCDAAGASHYLVGAEIPANLADRKELDPTAAVPIEISWPGATAADPNFTFEVACASSVSASGTSVNINGVPGTLSHTNAASTGPYSTISWSPAAGYVVSYSSWGGTNGPVSDTALIALARAVPTAP